MPAKKIKVIALDTPAAEESAAGEAPTEAQGMDEVMNNIQTENTSLEETTAEVPVPQEPAAKAAAKRKPRATKKTSLDYELLVPPEKAPPAPPAPTPEPEPEPVAEKVAAEKETCPDCGKLVSAKTLKYSHKANCKASKAPEQDSMYSGILDDKDPVGRDERLQKKLEHIAKVTAASPEPQDDLFSKLAMIRQARLEKKMNQYAKLTAQIF